MTIRIVRLGSPRRASEGPRLGTVRRPPRGVPKAEFASRNWYDVWFPNLAPSAKLFRQARSVESDADWKRFAAGFRREMAAPDRSRELDVLATLSHAADFSLGCYCADERRCHRSVLRQLLAERGAAID